MAATVTLELPESVLVQALKRLPPARRRQIWLSLEVDSAAAPHDSAASGRGMTRTLDKALGLLAVGQAAPTDAEIAQLLEERRAEKYG